MALFKISKGNSTNLPTLANSGDGYSWFTYDDGKFYIDYKESANGALKRKALSADRADKDANGNIIANTYVKKSGDTMTGALTVPASTDTLWANPGLCFTNGSRISENAVTLGIYTSGTRIVMRPNAVTAAGGDGIEISAASLIPGSSSGTPPDPPTMSLGDATHKWSTVYATTFNGNATTASALASTGTTGQFWRGDNTWSHTLTGMLVIDEDSIDSKIQFTRHGDNPSYLQVPEDSSLRLSFGAVTNGGALAQYRFTPTSLTPFNGTQQAQNGIALGAAEDGSRWTALYVGTADTYGSTTQPIYWNNGVPTAINSISLTGNLNVAGNTSLYNQTNIDNLTAGTLIVTGAASFTQIPTAPTPTATDNSTKIATTAFVKNSVAGLSGAMHFRGTTSTAIADGDTTNPITIGGNSYTAEAGDVILYEASTGNIFEYVWTGIAWEMLGRDTSFKVQQTAVVDPTASGTATAFIDSISQDANGNITVTKKNLDTSGTWSGNAATATAAKLTTTTNAIAYYTDTFGTFGSKASAKGALYATATNGALTFGTLPVAEGGTGCVSWTTNRLIYASGTTTLTTSGHYIDNTHLAINSTISPAEAFYVNGNTRLAGSVAEGYDTTATGTYSHAEGYGLTTTNTIGSAIVYTAYTPTSTKIQIRVPTSLGAPPVFPNRYWKLIYQSRSVKIISVESTSVSGSYYIFSVTLDQYLSTARLNAGTTLQLSETWLHGADGNYSHTEGESTVASGEAGHAEGYTTRASGSWSHAAGRYTTAKHRAQYTFGEYNILDSSTNAGTEKGTYIEIVGNGTSISARSNARTLDWNGNEQLAGNLLPMVTETKDLGSSSLKWADVYATTFNGKIRNATTAAVIATIEDKNIIDYSTRAVMAKVENGVIKMYTYATTNVVVNEA